MSDPIAVSRRLVAVFAADVEGYSRLMGADEVGTLKGLTERRAILDRIIGEHGGRIANTAGDSVLAEFGSAVEAVECAVEVQTALAEVNTGIEPDRRIGFRIGVHVGDVMVRAGDLFGDGVNIAARLEGLAEPGGICVSSSAYEHVQGKVAVTFTDLGEHSLKNIARPIRAYAVGLSANDQQPAPLLSSAPHLSLVVLPFANIGGDPEQDYFVDGVTESLTTDLSRISGAFVIARNTAFTFKGKAVDVKKLGRELNIRYVLEGSVQRGGNRLRVNVQLIDAETGNHLWAERFDKPVADLFDMQDEIVSRLANTLGAELIAAEARRAERVVHPDVMDLFFQGAAYRNKAPTPENLASAKRFFERALTSKPENVEALVGLAHIDAISAGSVVADDRAGRFVAAEMTLNKVLSLAPEHPQAHMLLGFVQISTNRAAQGIAECELALALDRNLAGAHGWIGLAKIYMGLSSEVEAHIQEALRLSPRDTGAYRWLHFVGVAKAHLNADADAVVWTRRRLELNRNYAIGQFHLAAALARLGQLEQARAAAHSGLALDPNFTLRRLFSHLPSDNPTYLAGRQRIYEGMRLAGVPEG